MFYDAQQFRFTEPLEHNWRTIYDEFRGIRDDLVDWYETELFERGWKVFRLFDFPNGNIVENNASRCPVTTSLIQQHFPSRGAAGFSVLLPGTAIKPHHGYAGQFLRCHLGLNVPSGDCHLKVGDETRAWQTGKVTVFDDRVLHEAWNLTESERVVLLVDFIPQV